MSNKENKLTVSEIINFNNLNQELNDIYNSAHTVSSEDSNIDFNFNDLMVAVEKLTSDTINTIYSQVENMKLFNDEQADKLMKVKNLITEKINDYWS
jgi:hypothetical protein